VQSEVRFSPDELATAVGISRARLIRLVRLGLVEATTPGAPEEGSTPVFTAMAAARLRRMLRLHRDLGVNLADTAIIVGLLERLDRLERELARLRESGDVDRYGGGAWTSTG
jgi:chaperone modulatory protein CbpM